MTIITVFGHDPGAVNYGAAVVSFKVQNKKVKYRIAFTCKLEFPANIQGTTAQEMGLLLNKYDKGVRKIIRDHKVTHSVAERFMSRGHGGTLIESVNMMLGRLSGIPKHNPILLSASTWKNRVNKFFDLKEFYKQVRVEPHEIDALLMAMYCAEKVTDTDILSRFAKEPARRKLIKRIEGCTRSELKKEKKKSRSPALSSKSK